MGIEKKNVHISRLKLDCSDCEEQLRSSLDKINWKSVVKSGSTVTVKVNATHFVYLPGLTTTPELAAAFVRILRDRAERVIVGDSDLQRVCGEMALEGCEIQGAVEKAGGEVLNFSKDKMEEVDVGGEVLKKMMLPRAYLDCDLFASMPVFKTHKLTQVTLTLKNHFGCIPDDHRFRLHKVIHKVLADITKFLDPKLIVMDGRIGLEGDGPIAGVPKKLELLLVADNCMAADSVASHIMGFDPKKVDHIVHAHKRGLGPIDLKDINVTGLSINQVKNPFEPAVDDIISKLERLINPHPIWSKIIYKSPLFTTMKFIAWKVRGATGYKSDYEEKVKATGLWGDHYQGLFE
jgi:uncharacterized protein (DUF362 family)